MVTKRRPGGVITTEEKTRADEDIALEKAADELLAQHGFRMEDMPLLTERGLFRKMRREIENAPVLAEDTPSNEICEYLIERHLRQLGRDKKLTGLQMRIYELHLRGFSLPEIVRTVGLSRQRVRHALQTARHHAQTIRGRYDGLHQIYWGEVRRYVYRKPRHAWEPRTEEGS